MSWLPLTLICALSLALADSVMKGKLGHLRASQLVLSRFGWAAIWLLPLAWMQPWPSLPMAFWGYLALAIPLELLAMGLYMQAIRQSPLSLTLPYLAFTPVLTALISYLLLGETLSPDGLAGILLIVLGTWLLNRPERRQSGDKPLYALAREPGSRLMLVVATIYAFTATLGKAMLGMAPALFLGPFYFVVLGGAATLVFLLRAPGELRTLGERMPWQVFAGALMAVMVVTHFLALGQVETAYMIAVKRMSLLFGIVFGALWFDERHLGPRLLAGGLMVLGVWMVV